MTGSTVDPHLIGGERSAILYIEGTALRCVISGTGEHKTSRQFAAASGDKYCCRKIAADVYVFLQLIELRPSRD